MQVSWIRTRAGRSRLLSLALLPACSAVGVAQSAPGDPAREAAVVEVGGEPASAPAVEVDGPKAADRPVTYTLRWLRGERDRLADDLRRLHGRLVERARVEDPTLVARLEEAPPKTLARGYGRLPEVRPDEPLRSIPLRETTYSLEFSSRAYSLAFRDASILAARAEEDPELPLEWAVGEYERIQKRMRNLDDNLAYQEFWQPELVSSREFFDERNEVLAQVRELRTLRESGEDAERLARLEREVRQAVAPFYPTPGLAVSVTEEGRRILPVTVVTDIEDTAFLDTFVEAVRVAWTDSEAAREVGLRVELHLERVAPEELYPEGPPEIGSTFDLADHLERFGEGKLVLTTGAESTHSIVGRYIQIGVRVLKPRVLAHEFGHLLGFSDGYLRGYEGDPEGTYGALVIEVTGLLDDLMGSPGFGRTSTAMIEELLEAYGS